MANHKKVRWKQRFLNLKKAYYQLSRAMELNREKELSRLEKEGIIQRFEYTFELSWKTVKDYLESEGETVRYPREVIKSAFQSDLIKNGEVWIEMLESRNLLSHTYDEKRFDQAFTRIVDDYYKEITQVYNEMERIVDE